MLAYLESQTSSPAYQRSRDVICSQMFFTVPKSNTTYITANFLLHLTQLYDIFHKIREMVHNID